MDSLNFRKEEITTEHQVKINGEVSDLINAGREDAVIVYHLIDSYAFTLPKARLELKKARAWMGWYARA